MFVLYDYSAIYKSFHFSKSFRCFFSNSIVFLSFSSILQQRMVVPPFPEDWRMTQESLSDPLRQNRWIFLILRLSFDHHSLASCLALSLYAFLFAKCK